MDNQRINKKEALDLATKVPFLDLAKKAHHINLNINKGKTAFLVDCNINYTNICRTGCLFCAFSRPKNSKEAWELSLNEISHKIDFAQSYGADRILLQGGMHPDHDLNYFIKLVKHIKTNHKIHLHAFSPTEIDYVSQKDGISTKESLSELVKAGLDSIPGGGAEILVDKIRKQISPLKCNSATWLRVMKEAHELGLKTTATMMFGHIESWEDRIEHLDKLRSLQDKTGGFISFIPWTFKPANSKLANEFKTLNLVTAHEYLRLIAISRLFLDNIAHIQASMLTQGEKIAQTALHFGADDIGSIMIEEHVVASAGCEGVLSHKKDDLIRLIKEANFIPYERNTFYEPKS